MEQPPTITLPYAPRVQQVTIHELADAYRFGIGVCHRRFGKTVASLNTLIRKTLTCPLNNPRGAYIAPLLKQAKAVAWDYLKYYSRPIPGIKINEAELRIDYPNGARIQIFGADNWLALKGQYFDYVICDEYAQWQPGAWSEAIRPALSDRRGGAFFIGTPRGHNEFYELWERAEELPTWGRVLFRASQTGIIAPEEIIELMDEMTEDEFAQEYECSWEAAIRGAFYGKQMRAMEDEGRITKLAHNERLPVHTTWDLGTSTVKETLVVGFWQIIGNKPYLLRVWAEDLTGFPSLAKRLRALPYKYGLHIAPHDINVGELGTGVSRMESARQLGIRFTPSKKLSLSDGIDATRSALKRMWINEDKEETKDVVEALKQYRTEFDDKTKTFKKTPLHDWTSHYCDMIRYYAVNEQLLINYFDDEDEPMDYSLLDKAVV